MKLLPLAPAGDGIKVLGDGFKFRDYLTGTGRDVLPHGPWPEIADLLSIQSGLVRAEPDPPTPEKPSNLN